MIESQSSDHQQPAASETVPETNVPDWQTAEQCRFCDRPLPDDRLRTLHEGLAHPDELSTEERQAYERATVEEMQKFSHFRLAVLGAVFVLIQLLLFAFRTFT